MNGIRRQRIAILISGRGTNMTALAAACMDPTYPGQIVGVIANHADAPGLETAERSGLTAIAVEQSAFADRAKHEAAVLKALDDLKPDVVCLAGYMRILSEGFVRHYTGRLINIHPSLLPLFPGLDTHRRALATGMRVHGCTVHFVTDRMDEGPIIAQAAIAIEPGDTAETLAERLLRAEHRLYPHALRLVLDGTVRMVSGRAIVKGSRAPAAPGDDDPPYILVSPEARRG
ncbi:phosphoribosylglycinamide formyltransferase [Aurantimonas marianensis]|uniref:Phosphoribosylglycinamide formyltransferase n=1 Tax=Aurantimonas marianensis TaxID=2920428 RepID=A0A9X2KGJ6_9HYPH|nr:phosphoribosylglycinamide formyltransferase [Aurantimonas marianensis]MCP3056365.1 phosphoribosylglycinamide formyltransferase [Aurantimonas marianensis]